MIKKGRLKEIVSELQGASKMHLKQSKEIEKHIDDMGPKEVKSIEGLETQNKSLGVTMPAGAMLRSAGRMLSPEFPQSEVKNQRYADAIQEIQPFELKPDNSPGNQDIAPKKAAKCWKGYVAKGKKKSPSRKKTKGGKIKMVNNCVKK
tara:strand:- start:296 stop:739 length:444 start_codon:yes stop_codon:yes gene_type:complete